jgi:uncharacterized repeat protein (TIGR01451 family)
VAKDAPATAIAGNGFDYTLTVTNNGPSTHTGGISVSDTLPAGTSFQASTDCSAVLQVVTCSRSVTLASGATSVFTIHVTVGAAVADGTDLVNSGSVSSSRQRGGQYLQQQLQHDPHDRQRAGRSDGGEGCAGDGDRG